MWKSKKATSLCTLLLNILLAMACKADLKRHSSVGGDGILEHPRQGTSSVPEQSADAQAQTGNTPAQVGQGGDGSIAPAPDGQVITATAFTDQEIAEGTTLLITLAQDTGELSCVGCPAEVVIDNQAKSFSWTPTYYQAGEYHLVVREYTSDGEYISHNFLIIVTNVNRPPDVQNIDDIKITEKEGISSQVDASESDSEAMTYVCVDCPDGFTLDEAYGTFHWFPKAEQVGTHTITIEVRDNTDVSTVTFSITVENVNDRPVFEPIPTQTVAELDTLTFDLVASDIDGDTLTYICKLDCPPGLTVTGSTVSWTPAIEQAGAYVVTFEASDGALTAEQQLLVNVADTPLTGSLALGIADSTAAWAYGFSADQKTVEEANQLALANCNAASCAIEANFTNSCAAFAANADNASGPYNLATAFGFPSKAEAESKAVEICDLQAAQAQLGPCKVIASACSGLAAE